MLFYFFKLQSTVTKYCRLSRLYKRGNLTLTFLAAEFQDTVTTKGPSHQDKGESYQFGNLEMNEDKEDLWWLFCKSIVVIFRDVTIIIQIISLRPCQLTAQHSTD